MEEEYEKDKNSELEKQDYPTKEKTNKERNNKLCKIAVPKLAVPIVIKNTFNQGEGGWEATISLVKLQFKS